MKNLKDMRGKLNALATEMSELYQKDERSSDEESRLDAVINEFNELGPQVKKGEAREAAFGAAQDMRKGSGSVARSVASGVEEDDDERTLRSVGERFAHSDAVKNYRGKGRGDAMPVDSFYRKHQLQHNGDMGPDELRALVQTGNLPADYIAPQVVSEMFRGDDLQPGVRDVLINGTTTSDAIVFFRELAFTNNAAGVAQATATTGATGLKPESAITFEQDTAPVVTIAHWIPITRQTLQDASQIRTYVEQRLLDGLKLEESDQLLNGTGTADLDGILNTSDIQYLDNTASTGYWATNPLPSVGEDRENFDRVLHAKTVVRTVGRGRANFGVFNPADLEKYLMTVDANKQYYGAGPFGGSVLPTMWGLRIVEDENIAEGEALVGDGRMAAVWDRMQAQILVDTIDDQFVRNMLTLLAEERLALTVFRPAAFAHVELAAW